MSFGPRDLAARILAFVDRHENPPSVTGRAMP
jgi:hypothetical protein